MKKYFILSLLLFSMSMYAYVPVYYRTNLGYYPDGVMDIEHDAQHLYVARGNGLFVIDKATGEETVFSKSEGTLAYTPISLAMYGDDLWIGTGEGKVLCYKDGSIQTYDWNVIGNVTNIAFDSKGSMYISSMAGTGYRINIQTKAVEEQIETFSRFSSGVTGHLCVDDNDDLWIGNIGGLAMTRYGLGKYTKGKGTQYMIRENPEWPGYYVASLAVDNDGCIWYINYGRSEIGYWLTKIEGDEVAESYECPNPGWDMMFDRQQRLWMLGKNGPLVMMKDGVFSSYSCLVETNLWTCIDIDGDDIYIGTDKGVLKFNEENFEMVQTGSSTPSGIASMTAAKATTSPIFDLQGRYLHEKPERGVYIQDGKKKVVK